MTVPEEAGALEAGLPAGMVTDAAQIPIPHAPLPASEVRAGAPAAGIVELGTFRGVEVGVWEMTPGIATDIEADEVFVVLAGHARIEFVEPPLPAVEVGPGSVVRLTEGMRTVWTVTETLRKICLA